MQLLFAYFMCVGIDTAEADALVQNRSMILGVACSVLLAIVVVVHRHPFSEFSECCKTVFERRKKWRSRYRCSRRSWGTLTLTLRRSRRGLRYEHHRGWRFGPDSGRGLLQNIPGFEKVRFTFVVVAGVKLDHICPFTSKGFYIPLEAFPRRNVLWWSPSLEYFDSPLSPPVPFYNNRRAACTIGRLSSTLDHYCTVIRLSGTVCSVVEVGTILLTVWRS